MNNLSSKLVENYKNMPGKICLIQKNKKVTYRELYERVSNFKKYLEANGIKKGQKILILVPMSIELYVSLLAVWAIGAIPCFMDAGFIKSGIYKNDFDDINAIIGITKYIMYSNINKNLRKLKVKINVNKTEKKLYDKLEISEIEEDYPAILTYTSGTTGKPKIAERTHKFLKYQSEILEKTINYENTDIEISSVPIFALSNINVGITTVITDGKFSNLGKSNPKKIVEQIIEEKVNRIMAAPGLLNVIIDYCIQKDIKLVQVKKVFSGGGAIFVDFIQKLKDIFPNAEIITIYGSTEAEPISELNIAEITEEDINKIKNGYGVLAGNIVGVEDCKTIRTGIKEIGKLTLEEFINLEQEVGEIVVSGKNVLKGYVNGIGDKENKFSVDGKIYHRTGDLGVFDEYGRLWLRGRISEPYFDIESALHARFKLDKTAVFKNNEKIILVLENKKVKEQDIRSEITFKKIDEIKYVKRIPVDKRHNTKVDYKELKKLLNM